MLINSPNISGSLTVTGNSVITGSLTVLGGINGAITGSAATASYVEYNNVANKPTLVSGSEQISFNGITDKPTLVSSSSQITYSGLTGIPSGIVSGSAQVAAFGYATTGSNIFIGNQTITGSILGSGSLTIDGCITATGQIVAQTINVQQVTSSIVYSCGSNIFGTSLSNTQQFTGSMFITGSNLNANVGSACFQGSICAPSFIGDVQSSILCSNTINLSGNNNALACNNTLRFTDTDTATELNQQIGKIEFFSCDSSTPGAGVKAYIGAFAADSTPDAYIAFATQDGSGTPNPVERLRISSEGIACFQNNVCAPNAVISNCLGVGIPVPQGNFEAVGLSYFTRASNSLLVNPNYGGANTHAQLQVVCNMALAFATNGDNERMRITSTGIACFACQVCAPVAIFSGCVGIGITSPSQILHLQTAFACSSGVGTALQITSDGAGGDQAWVGVNKGTGNGLEFSVENRDIIFNTFAATPFGGCERMRITSGGDLILGRSDYNPKFYMTSTGGIGTNERFYIDGYAHGGGAGYGGGFRLYTRDTVNVFHQRLTIDSGGATTFSSSVTTPFLRVSDSAGQIGEFNSTNANGGYITWGTSGTTIADIGTTQQIFGTGGNDTFGINGRGARALTFGTNNTERMRIISTGIACFACQVCLSTQLVVKDGVNSIFTWSSEAGAQPGMFAVSCLGSSFFGLYAKMYGPSVNAGIFSINTQCVAFVGTEGACNKGLIVGTVNEAPIYIGTNNSLRLTINGSNGIACFANTVCTPLLTVNSAVRLYGSAGGIGCAYIITATGADQQPAIILEKAGGYGQSEIRTYYNNVPDYGLAFRAGNITGLFLNSNGTVSIPNPAAGITPLYINQNQSANGYLHVNGDQRIGAGSSVMYEYVGSVPAAGNACVLVIPTQSQGNLHTRAAIEIHGVSAEYNLNFATGAFGGIIAFEYLNNVNIVQTYNLYGTLCSASISGNCIRLHFNKSYNGGTGDFEGITLRIKLLTTLGWSNYFNCMTMQ